jgi:transposase InsO family protein
MDFSRPGKPTGNAFIEAFNGRFQAECLNTHWFLTLADARGHFLSSLSEIGPSDILG